MEQFRLLYINHGLKEAYNRFHESLKDGDKQNSVSYAASHTLNNIIAPSSKK